MNFNPDAINCICGFLFDDGFSIACDDCSRWCHAACFDIVEGEVPEEWRCSFCEPRAVDKERAMKIMKGRMREAERIAKEREWERELGGGRLSPGAERKPRRVSSAMDGSKKRRRSINHPPSTPTHFTPQTPTMAFANLEDEEVNIDEPWTHSYIPITKDIIPHPETRDKLRNKARQWRGVTAISNPLPAPTTIQPIPPQHPHLIRPPSYALHTTSPIPSSSFITPYPSTITPSSTYLSDPLNAYAHLGMPKPFVHLVGGPYDLTLDARVTGSESRWVRSGCRPNSVLRPVLCKDKDRADDAEMLTFGVFALRDLKANEEIILGWEWDDGNAIHALPALIQNPHTFP